MKYPFDTSENLIYQFEELLKSNGLEIAKDSDLEKISFSVLATNAKHKKEIDHDNSMDIRTLFSDVAGLIDFVTLIVKHRLHKDFLKLIPHLQLLNTVSSTVLTGKSKVTDDGNNKLFELYIALLCMSISDNVDLDDPKNSKGDNPDIIFNYKNVKWAIACKALHANKERTLYDNIEKGTEQINRSAAIKGLVVINLKNVIDRDQIWPIVNPEKVTLGEHPLFGHFPSVEEPIQIIQSYGIDFHKRLIDTIGTESLLKLSESNKTPPGFLIFLHAITSVFNEGKYPPTILKTFNFVNFNQVDQDYIDLVNDLNLAMHLKI